MSTISHFLEADHLHCDRLFRQLESCVADGRSDEFDAVFATFGQAMERHFFREEKVLFVEFERATRASGPTRLMGMDHLHLRAAIVRMADAIEERNVVAFFKHADTLRVMFHEHNLKEESIHYLMFDRILADRHEELVKAMRALDEESIS